MVATPYHTETHCTTLQHSASHLSSLLHTAPHCTDTYHYHYYYTLLHIKHLILARLDNTVAVDTNRGDHYTRQHTTPRGATLHHNALHTYHFCNTRLDDAVALDKNRVTNCSTPQHTAIHCNTLHHTATHCTTDTILHTTTHLSF